MANDYIFSEVLKNNLIFCIVQIIHQMIHSHPLIVDWLIHIQSHPPKTSLIKQHKRMLTHHPVQRECGGTTACSKKKQAAEMKAIFQDFLNQQHDQAERDQQVIQSISTVISQAVMLQKGMLMHLR